MDKTEIELKLRVAALEPLVARLEAAGYQLEASEQDEVSVLWDREGTLQAKDEALRVRTYGARTLLTWKGPRRPDPQLKIRPEQETWVGDAHALEGILRALGYQPRRVMRKRRALWAGRGPQVALDRTPFGCFVELEGDPEAIAQGRHLLGLAAAVPETRSYAELFAMHDL